MVLKKGTEASETLQGTAGADTLYGYGGDDVLVGGIGNDILDGGTGNNTLNGGLGNDTYIISGLETSTTIIDEGGTDTLALAVTKGHFVGSNTIDLANYKDANLGDVIDNLNASGVTDVNQNLTLTGNSLSNIITAGAGADTVYGGAGDDSIYGGKGNDVIDGGTDNDVLYGGDGMDTISGGMGNDRLFGEKGDDVLSGGAGDDELQGGDGNDTLDGGSGTNILNGGKGNDTYLIDGTATKTTIVDAGGIDTVKLIATDDAFAGGSSYTLDLNVDILDASAITATDLTLTGTSQNDKIIGGAGNDIIYGGIGDDTLYGGLGSNILYGGLGNDTYLIDGTETLTTISDDNGVQDQVKLVTDKNGAFAGKAQGEISLVGFSGVENLDASAIKTTDMTLTGNDLANTIRGGAGDDSIDAGDGNDTIYGGLGNDTIYGGKGTNRLYGGKGDDTYLISGLETGKTIIQELANEGNDTVKLLADSNGAFAGGTVASISDYSNVENLDASAITSGNLYLSGNYGDNLIIGGAGDDTINSSSGNDTIDGGAGTNTLIGGSGNDTYLIDGTATKTVIVESKDLKTGGVDTVKLTANYTGDGNISLDALSTTAASVENLDASLVTSTNLNLTGNAAANIIISGAGDDTLTSGAGNDTLTGGDGANTFKFFEKDQKDLVTATNATDIINIDTSTGITSEDLLFYNDTAGNLCIDYTYGGVGKDIVTIVGGHWDANTVIQLGTDSVTIGAIVDTLGLSSNLTKAQIAALKVSDKTAQAATLNSVWGTPVSHTGDDTYLLYGDETKTIAEKLAGGNDTLKLMVNSDGKFITTTNLYPYPQNATYSYVDIEKLSRVAGTIENIDGSAVTSGNLYLTGNNLGNIIKGGAGDDYIQGGTGKDTLFGGAGSNVLRGGAGDDTYLMDGTETNFNVSDTNSGGADRVVLLADNDGALAGKASASYALPDYIEILDGSAITKTDLTLTGATGGPSTVYGGGGNDTIYGGQGGDILYGGAGSNTLNGGLGNDTYLIDGTETSTTIIDLYGIQDTIKFVADKNGALAGKPSSSISLVGIGVENIDASAIKTTEMTLVGNEAANVIYGGDGGNYIDGGAGADTIYGGDGNDTIYGGTGANWINGGAGDDTYLFSGLESGRTIIQDTGGNDTFKLMATSNGSFAGGTAYSIYDYTSIENLDGSAIKTGMTLAGTMFDNLIIGGDGNDTLKGDAGNDTLDGGKGTNTLIGGTGNDTYLIHGSETKSVIFEYANQGTDTVKLTSDYSGNGTVALNGFDTTANTIENLDGSAVTSVNLNLTGNTLANKIIGGAGDDTLTSGIGNDTLTGGLGADTFKFFEGDQKDLVTSTEASDIIYIDGNTGITASDILFYKDASGNFCIDYTDASTNKDVITISNWNADTSVQLGTLSIDVGTIADLLNKGLTTANKTDQSTALASVWGGIVNNSGNDTYLIYGNETKTIAEKASGGNDTLKLVADSNGAFVATTSLFPTSSTVSIEPLSKTANTIENIDASAVSATNLTLIGNDLNNTITGGDANDTIDGGAGNDTIYGGDSELNNLVTCHSEYDAAGNISSKVSKTYDASGNVLTNETISYSPSGNVTQTVDKTYTYDSNNRQISYDSKSYNSAGTLSNHSVYSYTYDSAGHQLPVEAINYDGVGNVTSHYTVAYTYDSANNVASRLTTNFDASGAVKSTVETASTYDANSNNLSNINVSRDESGNTTGHSTYTYTYDSMGNILTHDAVVYDAADVITYNIVDERTYDQSGNQLSDHDVTLSNGVTLENSHVYAYDSVGNKLSDNYTQTDASGNVTCHSVDTYAYDSFGNLSTGNSKISYSGGSIFETSTKFTFDSMGNELSYDSTATADGAFGSHTIGTYTYDSNGNKLTYDTTRYDASGAQISHTLKTYSDVHNVSGDTLIGGVGNDTLTASKGDDVLLGGAGNDALNGGAGKNILNGGSGNDTYLISGKETSTTIVEAVDGGTDTVKLVADENGQFNGQDARTTVSIAKYAGVENLDSSAITTTNLNLIGNTLNNVITGGAGDDYIYGGDAAGDASSDTLIGGLGNDTLVASSGNDVLIGGAGDDILTGGKGNDTLTGGDGADTFKFFKGDGHDTIVSTDTTDTIYIDSSTGITLDDILYYTDADGKFYIDYTKGGIGADVIEIDSYNGFESLPNLVLGTDTIDISSKYSTLGEYAGLGDSPIDNLKFSDKKVEASALIFARPIDTRGDNTYTIAGNEIYTYREQVGEGTDTFKLYADENGGFVATTDLYATSSTVSIDALSTNANTIENIDASAITANGLTLIGNDLANTITGGSANDTISAGAGNDTIYGGAGNDFIDGGAGNDVVYGGAGNDTLSGGVGNDAGNSHKFYYSTSMTAFTMSDSALSYGCNDTLVGGAGNDTYLFNGDESYYVNGYDIVTKTLVTEEAGGGTDTVKLVAGADGSYGKGISDWATVSLENFSTNANTIENIDGSAITVTDLSLKGNALDNTIIGGAGDDSITDGAGNDTIIGGKGDDQFWVGSGADTFIFNQGDGKDIMRNYSLASDDTIVINTDGGITKNDLLFYTNKDGYITVDYTKDGVGTDSIYCMNSYGSVSNMTVKVGNDVIHLNSVVAQLAATGTANLDAAGISALTTATEASQVAALASAWTQA